MGFSAGGEVAALAATRFDGGKPQDTSDAVDRQSSRPDFDALIYPGIRANNYTIPKDMPVTFLLCADNDRGPSTALSVLYPMLKAAGIRPKSTYTPPAAMASASIPIRGTLRPRPLTGNCDWATG